MHKLPIRQALENVDRERIRLIVDCDPGIDDAATLAFAAASPEFDLLGVTTVAGNIPVTTASANARALLAALGRSDVPVGGGADRPLIRLTPSYPPIHGENGLGGYILPAVAEPAGAAGGLELMARILEGSPPASVTLAAIGPLTNVALLLATRPDLADRIKLLAVMGGGFGLGNVTPHAEFNTWVDPEASHRVLVESELPVRLFTLGATRRAALDDDDRRELAAHSPVGAMLARMMDGYTDIDPRGGRPLHDTMVLAGLVDPGMVETEAVRLGIDTDRGPERGRTGRDGKAAANLVEAAVDADGDRFRELLISRV